MTTRLAALFSFATALAISPFAQAQTTSTNPTFGNRTEKPDGSIALTVGRQLQTEWETRFGLDAKLAPEFAPAGPPAALPQDPLGNRSTGALWGTIKAPGAVPIIWDKTTVDARVDPGQEQGRLGATLSRTVPLGDSLSVTLQDQYSVTQSLHGPVPAPTVTQQPGIRPGQAWGIDRSVRFNLGPTGTTFAAGVTTASTDTQWHNKFSAEQKLFGPLSVSTSIVDPGTTTSSKSISAGFKHTW